jgi:hypothetical protein
MSNTIQTVNGGPVNAEVHRTGAWQSIAIAARTIDEDDPEVTGHLCSCGDIHEKATDMDDFNVIELAPHEAVALAREILRLAAPLLDADDD